MKKITRKIIINALKNNEIKIVSNFRKKFIFFLSKNSIRKIMKYTPNKNKQKIKFSNI